MVIKKIITLFLSFLLLVNGMFSASAAAEDQMIYWGEVETGIYDLEFPILNEQSKLTGYDLQTQKMTKCFGL
ncbi:MAG: hypothetical protein K0Q73_2983 [Paenibacillus sp.]|nr:hypothetical protein [Paenibacillus sp.]